MAVNGVGAGIEMIVSKPEFDFSREMGRGD
jgi:hypothetical protein